MGSDVDPGGPESWGERRGVCGKSTMRVSMEVMGELFGGPGSK